MELECSFFRGCIDEKNFLPQRALELPKNETIEENNLYRRFTGVSSTFSAGVHWFSLGAKHFELNFFIRETLL